MLVLVLAALLAVPFRVWWTARGDDRTPTDVIVVLGAAQYDGTPSPVFEARLEHAKTLYDDGVADAIITVGGNQPGDRFTEGEAGRDWLVDNGVPASAVTALETGRDTWPSMQDVAAEMDDQGWTSATLVTDPWHEFRVREMARHLGIEARTSPTRTGPVVQHRITEARYVARESAAYVAWLLSR